MISRNVLIWPNVALLKICSPIISIDKAIENLVYNLIKIMEYYNNSIGIAASQIGVHKRVFVLKKSIFDNYIDNIDEYEVFINPVIIRKYNYFTWEEGCLSIPGEQGTVTRFKNIIVRYVNIFNMEKIIQVTSQVSGCIQHELDHLNGVLWIDYQSHIKKRIIQRKMLKHLKSY